MTRLDKDVQLAVLGPLEVRTGTGEVLEVGGARLRALLILLALAPGWVVTTPRLVDALWEEQLPVDANNALQALVSRLRRAVPGISVTPQPAGYRLDLDPDAVDAWRFERLAALGRAQARHDPAAAVVTLRTALALWRGPALADVATSRFAREPIARLDELRLAALQDRIEAELRLGAGASLVAELEALVVAQPLREPLVGQLMRALYVAGRRGAALVAYDQARTRLAEQLGTDPSAELVELHTRLLRGDGGAVREPDSRLAGADTRAVPRQLPAAVQHFAGRMDQLAVLTGLLRGRAEVGTVMISAIGGTAGVGKTALAVYWAHQVAERFPDGQLYVNLRGFDPGGQVMESADAVRRFLDALQVPPERIPADLDAQAALYRGELAGRRMLIVLDNARDTAQVRPLLPGAAGCLVLVTSRNQLSGLVAADGAHPIALDLLTPGEAWQLLARRLGPDRVSAEPEAVEEIITVCARLPLALAIVAARAATHPHLPLHTLAAGLRDSGGRLDALTTDDPHTDVRAVFSWSYHALTPDAARLFRLLGLHPGPDISAAAVASLAAVSASRARALLGELTRANLLVEHVPGRYAFHDLLRAYATDVAHTIDPDDQRRAATGRILDHYLYTAYTAARLLDPARDPVTLTPPQPGVIPEHLTDYQRALDWFTAEHPVLLAAVDHAFATGFDTHTWQLAWTLATFLDRRWHWHDLAATQQAAVAAAGRLADPTAQARAHRFLAGAYIGLGRFDDADPQLRHALDLYAQAGDLVGQAHTHNSLSWMWERRGGHVEALDHVRQALDLFRAAGHRHGQARALNNIGWCHALLGDHQQALTHCQQALTLLQELDDRWGQATAWDSLGYAHHHLGHHTQAITCYQHTFDLYRDLDDRYGEATILTHLGDTHHAAGDHEVARDAWQQALIILDDLDHPDAEQVRTKLAALDTPTADDPD